MASRRPAQATLTEEQYLQLVMDDPDSRWELIDGEPVRRPAMTSKHEDITAYLGIYLGQQLDRSEYRVRIAGSRVRYSGVNYFVPDVFVAPTALVLPQEDVIAPEAFRESLPLVVEVWSPSTGRRDLEVKLRRYREQGHAEVWFIHPFDRTLTAWRRRPDGSYEELMFRGGVVQPESLPGVTIDLDRLLE
jgi:Uma2 family endonuclease